MNAAVIGYGLSLGVGLMLMLVALPALRHDLRARVAPFVSDRSIGAFRFLEHRRTVNGSNWTAPALARRIVDRFGPDADQLARLTRRAGLAGGAARVRLELTVSGAIGFGLGGAIALLSTAPLAIRLLLPVFVAGAAGWLRLGILQSRAKRRRQTIERELPTILEFLSLSVSAGESLPDAIERIARIGAGALPGEFAEVCRRNALGTALPAALSRLERDLDIPALTRLIQQLCAALERGAPIAGVLQAQTADQRVRFKQAALESAGRKEIAMMFPLVFLILPVTVVFAVWPGFFALNAGFAP